MLKPQIKVSAVGSSTDNGAGCCVILEYEDILGRKSKSVITHPIGIADEVLADVQAAHLGLGAIIRPMRKEAHVVLVVTDNVVSALSGVTIDSNVMAELNRWVSYYKDLDITVAARSDIPGNDMAIECANSQKGFYKKTRVCDVDSC
jgi:hypothetical protein